MEYFQVYILLFCIIIIVGQVFKKSPVPISLLLVVTGMLLSLIPEFPHVSLNPDIVLNIFLPLLIYQISAFSSWKDVKKNLRPITLLSVGHVIFITFLVAIVIHALIPQLGWPMAFILGAVVSPPDDVAVVSIAEKIHIPERVVTILEGEGMLNDATALILFRFGLAALIANQYSVENGILSFFMIVIGETFYGLLVGYIIGEIRLKIQNPMLHVLTSVLTPFLAYLPPEKLGGSGILATVITGFLIGNYYALKFAPEFRLVSRTIWPALAFAIESLLFLWVGLDLRFIIDRISSISLSSIFLYSISIILTVIIGRFIWVFPAAYLPRFLFPSIRKKDPYPPWQFVFIVAWAGMRGAISLAAVLAVPVLPFFVDGINPKDLLIFLVFSVIAATLLLQGLTLPWIIKLTGARKFGQKETYDEHVSELNARIKMIKAVLQWLKEYKEEIQDNSKLLDETKLRIREYRMLKNQLQNTLKNHDGNIEHDGKQEREQEIFLLTQIIEVERTKLLELWHNDKINLRVRNKLLEQLDHRTKHLLG